MKTMKRLLTVLIVSAVTAAAFMPLPAKAADGDITLSVQKVLTYQYQKPQKFAVEVKNNTTNAIGNIVVSPDMKDDVSQWPFKTEYQKYEAKIDTLAAGDTKTVEFNFTERDDVPSTRFTLLFKYTADGGITGSQSFYVLTTAKPADKNASGQDDNNKPAKKQEDSGSGGAAAIPLAADAGGFSNGDASYSGGGGEGGSGGSGSVPRVIVTGFDTDPAEVRAGSNFTLTIHLKNTSKATRVGNMLFDLNAPTEGSDEQTTAPAFLPASGSSSIYLDGIKANGTADISIQLNAKADLLQKPYSIDLSMKYEDADAAQIEGASSISIPVKQDARFEFSEFEISPEAITVGEEANVMCSLYNLGRIKLYNVKAAFEGKCVKKAETFIGNVESGATASIDATLEGTEESTGSEKVTMTLSYEDEAGKVSSMTKEFQLEVGPEGMDDMPAAEMEEMEQGGFPVIPVIVVAVIIAAAAAAIIIIKKKKKKQMADEEEGLLNELDGSAEDERE
ncbi:hypothetical protein [Dorea sp. D27]|uniref:COG1361 S-layer family protein n=1 Tax=Dorea sp. D27 TaxID=658665 RepID=UPI0006734D3F